MMMPKPRVLTIVGPESSGKTTLARALAERYGCPWVPEFARAYLEQRGPVYTEADLSTIAAGQYHALQEMLASGSNTVADMADDRPHVIVDSGVLSVSVWATLKYGRVSQDIAAYLADDPTTLYLVLRPVRDWTPDPLREAPGLLERAWIYNHYLRVLRETGRPFRVI